MASASPTVLALDIDSAWVVILAVSLVTLPFALFLRKVIGRPGGSASGLLLLSPLVLPVVAAAAFARAFLPEVAVLKPAGRAMLEPGSLARPLFLSDGEYVAPYALVGRAGPWLLLIGVSVASFMMIRRVIGYLLVQRLIRRSEEADALRAMVQSLSDRAGLKKMPQLLVMPGEACGAFALGIRSPRILISAGLVKSLETDELEAILAHEIAHLAARDVPLVFAGGLLRDLVAWNPLSHMAFHRLAVDREYEADRAAVRLTGRPLSLASGLLKVCDLMRGKRAIHASVVGVFKPGNRVTRRVHRLLALADGRAMAHPVGRLPYMLAALLVAVLGLQAAARLAQQDIAGVAIVWGAPDHAGAQVWSPRGEASFIQTKAQEQGKGGTKIKNAGRYDGYLGAFASGHDIVFEERHASTWMRRLARQSGIPLGSLQSDAQQGLSATPLFSNGLPIYMIELRDLQ